MPTMTLRLVAEDLDRFTNLAITPRLDEADWPWAVRYLDRLLLGWPVLERHIAHLEKLYQAEFWRFFRRENFWEGKAVPVQQNPRFRFNDFLDDAQAEAILLLGPAALREADLFPPRDADPAAWLLLNPYALWDLAETTITAPPDYWLDLQHEYADELAIEVGLDPANAVPLIDTLLSPKEWESRRKLANVFRQPVVEDAVEDERELAVRKSRAQAERTGANEWGVRFDADMAARLAARAYGDPTVKFTLTLFRLPRGGGQAQAEVELSPAPTKEDVEIPFRFRDGYERTFLVRVPPITKKYSDRPQTSNRSSVCDALPTTAFPEVGFAAEPAADWVCVTARSLGVA